MAWRGVTSPVPSSLSPGNTWHPVMVTVPGKSRMRIPAPPALPLAPSRLKVQPVTDSGIASPPAARNPCAADRSVRQPVKATPPEAVRLFRQVYRYPDRPDHSDRQPRYSVLPVVSRCQPSRPLLVARHLVQLLSAERSRYPCPALYRENTWKPVQPPGWSSGYSWWMPSPVIRPTWT